MSSHFIQAVRTLDDLSEKAGWDNDAAFTPILAYLVLMPSCILFRSTTL